MQIFATCPVVKIVLIAGSPIKCSRPIQRVRRALGIFTPSTMAGSPSHSVRDIQEPPRSWVGVCTKARTVHTGAVPELVRASLGWGNTRSINRISSSRRAKGSAVEEGLDRRRQSHERPAQAAGEIRDVLPPLRDVFPQPIRRILRLHVASVRKADSKRLTYCFDRPRMRTLGSLTTVPERPVVRNA